MKKKVLFLFFMLFIIFSISTTVSASVDDYIRGYAEAILEREFNLLPDSLLVKEGIITIGFENIENVDRDRLIAELSRIRDVK
ncbi:DUF1207 domain-containing protein, partial [bacterium]